jgi:hypothetical protein
MLCAMSFPYVAEVIDTLLDVDRHLPLPTFGVIVAIALLVGTAATRLLIEKIRINVRFDVFGLHTTQAEAISFLLVITGLLGTLVSLRTKRFWPGFIVAAAVLSACPPARLTSRGLMVSTVPVVQRCGHPRSSGSLSRDAAAFIQGPQ